MQILFTKSSTLGSWLIRNVTEEPVSHCAIKLLNYVLHATEGGVQVIPYEDFCKKNTVVFTADVPGGIEDFRRIRKTYEGKGYDYPALVFLGIRYMLKKLHISCPKVNLWDSTGLFMCTELVTSAILNKDDALITPYQLYKKLSGE